MKTIGIIGGMSAESTRIYYDRLNSEARRRLGGLHSADLIIRSLDFAGVAELQAAGRWDDAGRLLVTAARGLEAAGAEILLLATNTMHKVAPAIEAVANVPFIHIADATAERIVAAGCKRPALIATRFTMEEDFYVGRLRQRFGLDVVIPEVDERAMVHRVIYDELCRGIVADGSRLAYEGLARQLLARGADSVILGCTEVGMLLNAASVAAPVFDTSLIHADAALDLALADTVRAAAE
ncbi:MAG: aspartate/glutamate racemase family protein [Ancalomicrobiaceae bacterium]|nr:aspartate/glutamate racemase family protein [Ancalomicrobiaceae bacterium]